MNFPSKILLFGEYVVLSGGAALALPLEEYSGTWTYDDLPTHSNESLSQLWKYLVELESSQQLLSALDLRVFQKDLQKGLSFTSNIPMGYGLGSSGALVAGIHQRYALEPNVFDIEKLREELAQIECFFHGNSSGLDPLVSRLNKGVLSKDGTLHLVDKNFEKQFAGKYQCSLVDSGISRQTAPLVNIFKEKLKDDYFRKKIEEKLVPISNVAIEAYLNDEVDQLFESFRQISRLQLDLFKEMIPIDIEKKWVAALESSHSAMKLCGAGGGGMFLMLQYSDAMIF